MKLILHLAIILAVLGFTPKGLPQTETPPANIPVFKKLEDIKWEKILPDLGESSPEISFLHVDPVTKATKLLIRSPKAIHVRKPRTRYPVGRDAAVMTRLTHLVSDRLLDRMVRSAMGR